MILIDRDMIHKLGGDLFSRYRKSTFVMAAILSICGVLCLVFPAYSVLPLSYITGIFFIGCGLVLFINAWVFRSSGKATLFSLISFGIVYLLMGGNIFLAPLMGINTLSFIICILFMFAGLSRITAVFKRQKLIARFWLAVIGLMDIGIAFLWLSANANTTYMMTSMFIGLEMIASAGVFFTLSYGFGELKNATAGQHG